MCSLQIKIIELPSKTPVCTLVPDAKLGMVMCIKLWQVSTRQSSQVWTEIVTTKALRSINVFRHHKFNEFTLSANNKSRRLSTLSIFSLVLHVSVSILGCFILIRQQPTTRRNNRNQQKCAWKTWHMIYIPTTRPETFFQTFLLSWQRAPTL